MHTYVLDPERFKRFYGLPVCCPLCGHPLSEGTHRQVKDDPSGPSWVCTVPMFVHQPRFLGRLSS